MPYKKLAGIIEIPSIKYDGISFYILKNKNAEPIKKNSRFEKKGDFVCLREFV